MTTTGQNPVLLSLKEEPMDTIDSNITLVPGGILDMDGRSHVHEIKENVREVSSVEYAKKPRFKNMNRKSIGNSTNRRPIPHRSFSSKWLFKPEIGDWVCPIPNKPGYVFCKICKCYLRAHLHDLKKHADSRKHRRLEAKLSTQYLVKENRNPVCSISIENAEMSSSSSTHNLNGITRCTETETGNDQSQIPPNIGFIGCGNMAQALISGFISSGLVEPNNMLVSAPSEKNLAKLKPHGVKTTHENRRVAEESHMVFLAVKPHIIPEVFAQLEPLENNHNPLFVSVAAGLSITRLEAMLNHIVSVPRVIRVMPNTPCMVLQGTCVYSLGTNVQPSEVKSLKSLLDSVGLCVEVPEYQMDAASGVAGSGPAYIYAAIEAMADGGVKMGLPRKVAMALAAQTVKGAATMVLETGKHPGQLKDEVCSPGGTTITAMHSLEQNGLRNALISAVEAAANRAKELG